MKLVMATQNAGKLRELRVLLADLEVEVVSMNDLCPELEIEETGTTFMENARLKAQAVCDATGLVSLADDSGLAVDALDGRPGVYSARYCGEDAGYDVKIGTLLKELEDKEDRSAQFVCAMCCVFPDGHSIESLGVCEGKIGFECRGTNGFGYDPIFYVGDKTTAEISGDEKNAISHRGKAARSFAQQFKTLMGETK